MWVFQRRSVLPHSWTVSLSLSTFCSLRFSNRLVLQAVDSLPWHMPTLFVRDSIHHSWCTNHQSFDHTLATALRNKKWQNLISKQPSTSLKSLYQQSLGCIAFVGCLVQVTKLYVVIHVPNGTISLVYALCQNLNLALLGTAPLVPSNLMHFSNVWDYPDLRLFIIIIIMMTFMFRMVAIISLVYTLC